MDFVDVIGASGAAYRFRAATLEQLPVTAGNLIVATGAPPRLGVRLCASAHTLQKAAPAARDALAAARSGQVFIRLNIARATREAEHADIVAALAPELDLPDLD